MIISTFDADAAYTAFGVDCSPIDMASVQSIGVGANWAKIVPGNRTDPHQHDETETFVIVSGSGEVVVDAKRTPVSAGCTLQFEPFETHTLENTGTDDLVFATFYWRDTPRAAQNAAKTDHRRFDDRPVFVFSTPPTSNGGLHIGHLSGPYIGTDAYVRFQRMNGANVFHMAATDDFQSWVAARASREGKTPAALAAFYADEIAETLAAMDIVPDQWYQTSQDESYPAELQAFFSAIVGSGRVTVQEGSALFDGETGQYLYEPYVKGGCPTCGNITGGNLCEECGEPNFCFDLVDPQPTTGTAKPEIRPVSRYMMPLHELRDDVLEHQRLGLSSAKTHELASRVFRRERIDTPVTHPSSWGVPPAEQDVPGQVIWVWIDVAYGFLHNIELLGRKLGIPWRADAPQDDWKIVHFIGYDINWVYNILCPAFYKLAYPGWTPDVDYNVNEFYLLDGEKFSTSRGHVIWGKDILRPDTVDGVRFYLALTRPETRRTNFTLAEYEKVVEQTLVGTWQRWLNDLGAAMEKYYDGIVPDAGIWRPEHTAFLARLQNRLGEMTGCLGQDDFSLNRAAQALQGIVDDTVRFAVPGNKILGIDEWKDEARTAIALQLAAAKLLAHCAMPVMPRFAAALAGALGIAPPASWPQLVTLVPAGTRVDLARRVFFGAQPEAELPDSPLLPWLSGLVTEALRLPDGEPVAGATLVALGIESMQAITLQYQILEHTGADVTVEELLGNRTVAELATFLSDSAALAGHSEPAQEEVGA